MAILLAGIVFDRDNIMCLHILLLTDFQLLQTCHQAVTLTTSFVVPIKTVIIMTTNQVKNA
jgi:hypothetical protein